MYYSDTQFQAHGTASSSSAGDLEAMRQAFYRYQFDWTPRYFTDHVWDQVSPTEARFSAKGPFGVYYLEDTEVFRNMATAAPDAFLEAFIEDMYPYNSYVCAKEKLHCRMENGILTTEITTTFRDSDDYRYEDFILRILPYEKYTDLFGIEPGSLAEKDYRAFIDVLTDRCWESPLDLTFEEFTGILARFGGRTALDPEAYEAARQKAQEAGMLTCIEFMDSISESETEVFRFDARARKEIP